MAGKKRRRSYSFMSEMPRSNQENNEFQVDATDASIQTPFEQDQLGPTRLANSSQTLNNTNTIDAFSESPLTSGGSPLTSPLTSGGSGSEPITSEATRKKGRGPAIGYHGKEKIQIIFNEHMQPIGDTSTDLANLLGGIAKCGARAPLNVISWNKMPTSKLYIMWRDVQHKTDAPEGFKKNCLTSIGNHWKKWKSRVKSDYFTPNKDDPIKLLTPPKDSRVDPNKWPELVDYWKRDDVEAQSLRNSNNRKNLEFLPRTGRTSHANIREEMKANNEDTCRANVFIKTRTTNDGIIPDDDTRMLDRINEKLNEVPQSEQNDSFKEQVFIDLLGPDGHGHVKTFGKGPSARDIFGLNSSSTNTTSSNAIKMMVQSQVDALLEAKVAERVAEQVTEKVAEYEKSQVELRKEMDGMRHLLVQAGLLPPSSMDQGV